MTNETIASIATAINLGTELSVNYFFATIAFLVVLYVIVDFIANYITNYFKIGFDDSDNLKTKTRSGLKVYTDYKTGLQYIGTPKGGLQPRLDQYGNHMVIDNATTTDSN